MTTTFQSLIGSKWNCNTTTKTDKDGKVFQSLIGSKWNCNIWIILIQAHTHGLRFQSLIGSKWNCNPMAISF